MFSLRKDSKMNERLNYLVTDSVIMIQDDLQELIAIEDGISRKEISFSSEYKKKIKEEVKLLFVKLFEMRKLYASSNNA